MGRLIDADKITYQKNNHKGEVGYHFVMKNEIDKAPTVEAIPKADYEARLTELRSMTLRVKHNTGSIDTLIDKLNDLLSEV